LVSRYGGADCGMWSATGPFFEKLEPGHEMSQAANILNAHKKTVGGLTGGPMLVCQLGD
jgi:hypothetical protein